MKHDLAVQESEKAAKVQMLKEKLKLNLDFAKPKNLVSPSHVISDTA